MKNKISLPSKEIAKLAGMFIVAILCCFYIWHLNRGSGNSSSPKKKFFYKKRQITHAFDLRKNDFKDLPGFIRYLAKDQSPVSLYLFQKLPVSLQKQFRLEQSVISKKQKQEALNQWNIVLRSESIFDEKRFKQIIISPEIVKAARKKINTPLINRLLLQQVYHEHIKNTIKLPMPVGKGLRLPLNIYDDQFLEREGLCRAIQYILLSDNDGLVKSIDAKFSWKNIYDLNQRENIRGKIMAMEGTIVGLQPFKIGQKQCYLFRESDIDNFQSFIKELRSAEKMAIVHLQKKLSSRTLKMLNDYNALLPKVPGLLRKAIIEELNGMVTGPLLYEKKSLKEMGLKPETLEIIQHNSKNTARINRLILQDLFPKYLENVVCAASLGIEKVPLWMAFVITAQGQPYWLIFQDLPRDLRRYDIIGHPGIFLKVWVYENLESEKVRTPLFISKKIKIVAREKKSNKFSSLQWSIFICLLGTALVIFAAILHEKREKTKFNLRRMSRHKRGSLKDFE